MNIQAHEFGIYPIRVYTYSEHQPRMIARRERQNARTTGFTPMKRKPALFYVPPTKQQVVLMVAAKKEAEEKAQRAVQRRVARILAKDERQKSKAGDEALYQANDRQRRKSQKRLAAYRRCLAFNNAISASSDCKPSGFLRSYPWMKNESVQDARYGQ
jgi:hypothetical protein